MAVGSLDLHKAVVAAWNANTLDTVFKAYWPTADLTRFSVLHDQEASAGQPFPYCVFNQDQGNTISRMTSNTPSGRWENRSVPWEFRIFARQVSGNSKSAKQIAGELAEYILRVFGGHPTVQSEQEFAMDNGVILQSTYETEYGVRQGDKEWMWIVRYRLLLDVPVAS